MMTHPYGNDDEIIRVPFGPKPTETMPLEWAAYMLSALKQRNPRLFGELLTGAVGIEKKQRGSN